MSPRNFTRRFAQEIGTPPAAFVAAARLDHAQRLLATTELSIAEVAFAAGFGSAEAVAHIFRGRLGITPGKARQRNRPVQHPG